MEEGLSLDNILGAEEIDNLFTDPDENETSKEEVEEKQEDKTKTNDTTEINPDKLFEDKSESVGSDEEKQDREDTKGSASKDSSPKKSYYSSIAQALADEGIFPDLDSEIISNVESPEDFRDLIENQIRAELDERQKRIDDALSYGIEPSNIKRYEDTISYLNNINNDVLSEESDQGENLRKQLIFQDFINRGYNKERANREVQKSLNAGTDIEDAKEALKSNIDFFNEQYNNIIEEARKEEEQERLKLKERSDNLKKSIMNDSKLFGDLNIDKNTRQKIYDNISKPIYKDPETGDVYTAIQKYEKENRDDFIKNLGIIFTLTNNFKDFNGLLKGKIKKEVGKSLKELENVLSNTNRDFSGNLRFVSGVNDDVESSLRGWDLDV